MALLAILAAIGFLVSPPTRAEVLQHPVAGPMLVCFKYSTFDLAEGETIVDFHGGMETMAIEIEGPDGRYRIGESDIFGMPDDMGSEVSSRHGTTVYFRRDPAVRYLITGRPSFSSGQEVMLLLLDGPALLGRARDARIYDRLRVRDPAGTGCKQTFTYSLFFD